MQENFERLFQRINSAEKRSDSVSMEDIAQIPPTIEFFEEILICLKSDKDLDVKFGTFFCEALAKYGKFGCLNKEWMQKFASRFESLLVHESGQVRGGAAELIVRFQPLYPNFRELMLHCLKDSDPTVRDVALNAYRSYLHPKEIQPLLPFQDDPYSMETSMEGPLIYVLRNRALEIIEDQLQIKFPKSELTAALDGDTVFWWDWKPFLDWWNKNQSAHSKH